MASTISYLFLVFFFSSRRRHTRSLCDWSSDVCSSDLLLGNACQHFDIPVHALHDDGCPGISLVLEIGLGLLGQAACDGIAFNVALHLRASATCGIRVWGASGDDQTTCQQSHAHQVSSQNSPSEVLMDGLSGFV